ncbi:MAG: GNAT family N-acetyltransferase [Caldilineaceae bacterium]|nr:GNAT family N-acetyltransferase [Caldilineaceae bacterium]
MNPLLPADLIAHSRTLPLKPDAVTLTGRHVLLRALDPQLDAGPLYAVSNGQSVEMGDRTIQAYDADTQIWRYLFEGPFATQEEFNAYLAARHAATDARAFTVIDLATGHPVGVVNLMSNVPAHLRIELGGIWYSPVVQRTPANLETTYLLLRHLFELGYRRAEWKCHAHNERSRRSALRMGFRYEGTQEQHMIVKGRNRDTAWFRLLAHEWPAVQQRLELMLYGGC